MDMLGQRSSSLLLVEGNETIMAPLCDWLALSFPDVRLIATTDHQRPAALRRSESPDVLRDKAVLAPLKVRTQNPKGFRRLRLDSKFFQRSDGLANKMQDHMKLLRVSLTNQPSVGRASVEARKRHRSGQWTRAWRPPDGRR